jgi:hypothetical protein
LAVAAGAAVGGAEVAVGWVATAEVGWPVAAAVGTAGEVVTAGALAAGTVAWGALVGGTAVWDAQAATIIRAAAINNRMVFGSIEFLLG